MLPSHSGLKTSFIVWLWSVSDSLLSLCSLLCQSIRAGEGIPLKITLTTSDEVQQLRQQLADLEQKQQELQSAFHRVEFNFRCESIINMELQDFCTHNGLRPPARLFSDVYRDPEILDFLEYKKTLRSQAQGAETPGE